MPRSKDLSAIPTARRTFIRTGEWESGETRGYYYTGFEKVEKLSKAGNKYVQYYFYLLPIGNDGSVSEEETLGLFSEAAAAFKNGGIADYQEVKVTKTVTQGDKREQEQWDVVGVKNILPEADRPIEQEYPEILPPRSNGDLYSSGREVFGPAGANEIDVSQLPF